MAFKPEKRVAKDGTITYSIRVDIGTDPVTGKRRQTRLSSPTVKELRRRHTEMLHQLQTGTFVVPSNATTGDFLKEWLDSIAPTVRYSSFERFSQIISGRVIPALGSIPLSMLSPLHLQSFYAQCLQSGLSSTTVALYHNTLHRALDQAVRWQMIARNPCDAVDAPRETTAEMKTWSVDQVRQFLTTARDDDLRALWMLAIHTGMRRGEILALRWDDVDFERATIAVRRTMTRGSTGLTFGEPKSKAGKRAVALPSVCVGALREHRIRQLERRLILGGEWQDTNLVFERGDGSFLHPNTVLHGFQRLADRAGLPRIRFHDLRHTAATLMLANGEHPCTLALSGP